MTRRAVRFVGVFAAALIAAVAGVVAPPTPAGAATVGGTVNTVGWWTSRPGAQPLDGNGFEVALGPDGNAQSVAALAVSVDKARISKLTITLTESRSVGSEFSHLRICRAESGFAPANPGAFSDAPKIDCGGTVVDLVHSGSMWQGDLAKLLPDGGVASLGVVGVSDSQAPVSLLVQIAGVAIGGEGALVTASDTGDNTNTTDTTRASAPGSVDGSFGDTSFTNSDPGLSGFGGSDTVVPPTANVDATTNSTVSDSSGNDLQAGSIGGGGGSSRPWLRLVFLTPLSAALGVGLVYLRRLLAARGFNLS